MTSCFSKLPEARPPVARTPSRPDRLYREGAPPCTVHWRIPSRPGLWQVALSGWALICSSFPSRGTHSCFALVFQVAAAFPHIPPPNPPKLVTSVLWPRSYLTMQHLGARFPGALPPSCLFPYLGGKRNRETQGDRSVRQGVLPVQPSLGRGHQAASRVGGTGVFRLR